MDWRIGWLSEVVGIVIYKLCMYPATPEPPEPRFVAFRAISQRAAGPGAGRPGRYDGSTTAVRRQYDGSTTAAPRGPIMYAFFKSDFGVGFATRARIRASQERSGKPRSDSTTEGPAPVRGSKVFPRGFHLFLLIEVIEEN